MGTKVERGDVVKLALTGRLEDGTPVESFSSPLEIEIGTGKLIKGLDSALLGMEVGEQKLITVDPEEGYGAHDPELVSLIPLYAFRAKTLDPEIGMMLRTPHGDCRVTAIGEEHVEVNYNHPLAGKTLLFDVRVKGIVKKGKK